MKPIICAIISRSTDLSRLKAYLFFSIIIFIFFIPPIYSQTVQKQDVLAVLTHNIARFTYWPEQVFDNHKTVFNLCVIGDNVIQQSFAKMNNETVSYKVLHIINRNRLRKLAKCQLLFFSGLERNILLQVIMELKGLPVLTVGENREFIEAGGMVSLEQINGKMQIHINLSIIKQSKLEISSRLLKLTKVHDIPYPVN